MKLKMTFCITAAAVLVAVALRYMGHLLARDAVPFAKFDQVVAGMTADQVRALMGRPDYIRHDTSNTTAYFYGGLARLKLNSMEVYFDADGHVTGKFDDD